MEQRLTLTTKELKRATVLAQVEAEQMTLAEAAQLLGLSERQGWRLLARYRSLGGAGLAHGNRGRPSPRRLLESAREQIVSLAQIRYRDYNDQHLTEVLQEEHSLAVSRTSVRRLRRSAGLASPRKYRRRKGHLRRERYPQAGRLLQCDASIHAWLEGRGPRLALLAAIDDATNEVVGALFREQEDAAGYFLLLRGISQSHGLPLALYADRHTIFQSPAKPSLEQELAGVLPKSQFGRLLDDLQVELIAAHSPQAKGRIERLWQTLQDRLVKELRQAGASDLAQANQVLAVYLPKFNQHFQVAAAQPGSAFRPWPNQLEREAVFAFHYQRQVTNDHTISLDGHKLQLPAMAHGRSYARATVDLQHRMDGRLAVLHQGQLLSVFEPAQPGPPHVERFEPQTPVTPPFKPAQPVVLPQPHEPQETHRPAANHPWRTHPVGRQSPECTRPEPAAPAAGPATLTDSLIAYPDRMTEH
jgi:transposase